MPAGPTRDRAEALLCGRRPASKRKGRPEGRPWTLVHTHTARARNQVQRVHNCKLCDLAMDHFDPNQVNSQMLPTRCSQAAHLPRKATSASTPMRNAQQIGAKPDQSDVDVSCCSWPVRAHSYRPQPFRYSMHCLTAASMEAAIEQNRGAEPVCRCDGQP